MQQIESKYKHFKLNIVYPTLNYTNKSVNLYFTFSVLIYKLYHNALNIEIGPGTVSKP